jgi:hypothetical protein
MTPMMMMTMTKIRTNRLTPDAASRFMVRIVYFDPEARGNYITADLYYDDIQWAKERAREFYESPDAILVYVFDTVGPQLLMILEKLFS